eukprot:5618927-Heterocapsa_arctica.AAC.1
MCGTGRVDPAEKGPDEALCSSQPHSESQSCCGAVTQPPVPVQQFSLQDVSRRHWCCWEGC